MSDERKSAKGSNANDDNDLRAQLAQLQSLVMQQSQQLNQQQKRLDSINTAAATSAAPAIPDKFPSAAGSGWSVTVRHTPLLTKRLVVQATNADEAWAAFLAKAESLCTLGAYQYASRTDADDVPAPEKFKLLQQKLGAARRWLAEAKKQRPAGTEIIGERYRKARVDAMRIKGTVTRDQIGFEELASA